jgi:hypothetical protein
VQVTISETGNAMTYTKPEIAALGEAGGVIEQLYLAKGPYTITDPFYPRFWRVVSAYDLDE